MFTSSKTMGSVFKNIPEYIMTILSLIHIDGTLITKLSKLNTFFL